MEVSNPITPKPAKEDIHAITRKVVTPIFYFLFFISFFLSRQLTRQHIWEGACTPGTPAQNSVHTEDLREIRPTFQTGSFVRGTQAKEYQKR